MPPPPTGPHPAAARKSGLLPAPGAGTPFEAIKARVLAKLEDRFDPGASKRMPASLLRQGLRQHAEQVADQEARGLAKPDRDRLVDAVLAELLGYGPLDELFKDPGVREVMATGPRTVIARRAHGPWMPTSVAFRDENHFRSALDKLAAHADPVGGVTASVNLFDLVLPNGFRAVAVIPPPALEQPPTAAFVRFEPVTAPPPEPVPAAFATLRPSTGVPVPPPRPGPPAAEPPDPLARHRKRLTELLITRLAGLGVYDLQRIEIGELRKAVAAYVGEYAAAEKIYLSDTDQGRLTLEILTAMNR